MSQTSESEMNLFPTSEELEKIQENLAVRPPKIEGVYVASEAVEAYKKNPIFQEWSKAMTARFTRQYLMTNFLQYAWKNSTTYGDYPIAWKKTPKTAAARQAAQATGEAVATVAMDKLDKDTPDEIYLAAFVFYEIPIYTFHLEQVKRLTRQPTKKSAEKKTKGDGEAKKLKAALAKQQAELDELKALLKSQAAKVPPPKVEPEVSFAMAKAGLPKEGKIWFDMLGADIQAEYEEQFANLEADSPMEQVMLMADILRNCYKIATKPKKVAAPKKTEAVVVEQCD